MKIGPEELEQRLNRCQEGLKKAGVKLTHQRLEIFKEVAKSGDHPDAETIYKGLRKRLPTVSLDTVYRTLWLLLDLGLIDTLGTPHHGVRFDANTRPHHHFVCKKCGMTSDFYCEELDQITIPAAVKKLGRVEKTQVEIRGVCSRCSKKIGRKNCAKRKKEET
jgi:Fur family transcriptional regulator, peroxide stress response regulator